MALDCAIGIAFGEVTYGNVGSKEWLDFTVIDSAANIAARLGEYGKVAGHPVIATTDVAAQSGFRLEDLGAVALHNVRELVAACAVAVA